MSHNTSPSQGETPDDEDLNSCMNRDLNLGHATPASPKHQSAMSWGRQINPFKRKSTKLKKDNKGNTESGRRETPSPKQQPNQPSSLPQDALPSSQGPEISQSPRDPAQYAQYQDQQGDSRSHAAPSSAPVDSGTAESELHQLPSSHSKLAALANPETPPLQQTTFEGLSSPSPAPVPIPPPLETPTYVVRKGDKCNEEGAVKTVRESVDANGNVVKRTIRKSVEDFEFRDQLGSGSYSTVVAAWDKQTLKRYAIKILDKAHIIKEDKVKYVEIEKITLNRLGNHPGIVHLYYTFQDRASLFFVLDFAPNGELLHLVKRLGSLDLPCARYYAAQLIDSVEYMHKNGVIHRDLKPENVLLDYKWRIKITDFGTAKLLGTDENGEYFQDARAPSFVGTAEYVTPELLSQKYQGKACDVWAFGCVLYQMIAGVPPFQGSTQYLTFQKIVKFQYSVPPGFPPVVRDLLKNIFVGPRRRYKVEDVKRHPFFEGQDWSLKAVWGNSPPKLVPYKPTSASMAVPKLPPPRVASGNAPVVQQQQQQQQAQTRQATSTPASNVASSGFVPSDYGLVSSAPATRHGIPTRPSPANREKSSGAKDPSPGAQQRRQASASAATAALYKSAATATAGVGRVPSSHHHSPAYQQSQERLLAIQQRVRNRGAHLPPVSTARQPASRTPTPPNDPTSPLSPSTGKPLQLPPTTMLEGEYASHLMNSNERILKVGPAMISTGNYQDSQGRDEDESRWTRIFNRKSQAQQRIVLVTTAGRMLILDHSKRLRNEISLGIPEINMRCLTRKEGGNFVLLNTYNKATILEDPEPNNTWIENIELSLRYYNQTIAAQERQNRNAAAAAAMAVSASRR